MKAAANCAAGLCLELSRWLEAPPERVFEAFTDPRQLRQWWGPRGFVIEQIEFNAAPGKVYRVQLRSPEGQRYAHVGVITKVERPHRLHYTWQWVEGPLQREEMLVELRFQAEGAGTRVDLRQSRFIDQASLKAHKGWPDSFNRLEAWLSPPPKKSEALKPEA